MKSYTYAPVVVGIGGGRAGEGIRRIGGVLGACALCTAGARSDGRAITRRRHVKAFAYFGCAGRRGWILLRVVSAQ
jgi:hypothetical protein